MLPDRRSPSRHRRQAALALVCALLTGLAAAPAAQAQDDIEEISEPVVQRVPGAAGQKLNASLELLARNPNDVDALLAAGQAALGMGDVGAAVGFYQRASTLSPGNARIKAGLASAHVRNEDPFTAIALFDEAEKAGPIEPQLLGERALAYDLVGDNVTAQVFYKQALQAARDEETVRRYALSQAIAGDRRGMELALAPLLQQQDKGAWRARAFGLAILGSSEEAESIARSSMPAELANGISAYLRFMPRLTAAQQAAAANLGHFPRAADIGRDDPRLALYQRPRAVVARAEQSLTPAGKPLGSPRTDARPGRDRKDVRAARPEPAAPPPPVVKPTQVAIVTKPEVPAATQTKPAAPPPPPVRIAVSEPAATPVKLPVIAPPPASTPVSKPVQTVVLDPPPASPPPAPPVQTQPAKPRDLANVFADFVAPSREVLPAPGAVDVRKIPARKPDAKEVKKPEKPTHPSRIWVQVATGRNKDALAFDWRRLARENAKSFAARKGYISAWGQTNRLLTGPFESEKAATGFIAQLRKDGVDGAFVWNSPAGQVVDALAAAK